MGLVVLFVLEGLRNKPDIWKMSDFYLATRQMAWMADRYLEWAKKGETM